MNTSRGLSTLLIGLALFSMFFGSGNLIFPLYIGQMAQGSAFFGSIGFLLTGVALPLLGVIAMVVFKGNYEKFFSVFGERLGFLFIALLLTVWIPLGSSPRCITLAYGSIASYLPMPSLWIFSLIYCLLIAAVVIKRSRMIDILGYVLTPLLLLSLGFVLGYGLWYSDAPSAAPSALATTWQGVQEGYNTMDLIAAFFFSASIIDILRQSSKGKGNPVRITLKACLVAMALLGTIYMGMIYLAARHADILVSVPREQLLSQLSYIIMGPQLGVVTAIAVSLACFTTSIALVVVYQDFLNRDVFKSQANNRYSLPLTLVITFGMSITGLEGITAFTAPILKIFYPVLVLMIIFQLVCPFFSKKPREQKLALAEKE